MSNESVHTVGRGVSRFKSRTKALTKKDRICRGIIEYGILAAIIVSPLPAASVYDWSILVIQLLVTIMLGAYLLMSQKPHVNEYLSGALKIPKYLFLALFGFIVLQTIPLPTFLVKFLSPNAFHFRDFFSIGLSDARFTSISLIPSHTFKAGLELAAYFLLGFIIVMNVTKKRQLMRIFYVIVGMGFFEALYGMFALYQKNPRILFYKKIYNLNSVTGTFINTNHFSGYLEMVIPLAVGLIITRIDVLSLVGLKWKDKMLRISEKGWAINSILLMGVLGMSVAIIYSKSRSGVFVLLFTFLLFFGLVGIYFRNSRYQRRTIRNFLRVSLLALILISLFLGIGSTVERFSFDRILYESRPAIWANTIDIFLDYPLFGSGLGTFPSIYPQFEADGTLWHVFHAHNDYLEYLSELGVLGFSLLLGGICMLFIFSFLVWRFRRNAESKGLALGGIISIICILVHSFTDFNLHIPANMLLFSVVLSLTAVASFFRYKKSGPRDLREGVETSLKDEKDEP